MEQDATYNHCNCVELIKETTSTGNEEFYAVIRDNNGTGTYLAVGVNISDEMALDLFEIMTAKVGKPKQEILKRIELLT